MPRLSSARSVETVAAVGYHLCAPNLYLQVSRGGTKSWLFRFKSPVTAKQREMGLGPLDLVSLAQARQTAIDLRRQLLNGKDPLADREQQKRQSLLKESRSITFRDAAQQFILAKTPEWKNKKHGQQWANTLEAYVFPVFGNLSIDQIDTTLVLKALEPIWTTKAETASRVRQRVEAVWDWAKARGYVEGENPARLRGHIDKILAKTSKVKQVRHHPALPFKEIRDFIGLIRKRTGSSVLALEFLVLTASRTGEIIGATWREIDLDAKIWTIPKERVKAGKEHRVPLGDRCIDMLMSIKSNRNSTDFVFPGWKVGTGLSNGAMLALMQKMGFGHYTPHGFRSTFRDWAAEEAHSFQNETVELALAHTIKNQAEAAYRRGDQLERRRELMAAWSAYTNPYTESKEAEK
jgi:integrase